MNRIPSRIEAGDATRPRILFVCTGNVFRSLTAEHALRASLGANSPVSVSSAGTADYECVPHPFVSRYLLAKGYDVRQHRRRTLTAVMLEGATVIAMSTDHRAVLADRFRCSSVLLFTEACGLAPEPLPDLDEAVPDFETNPAGSEAHIRMIIDRIIDLTPALAKRYVQRNTHRR